MGRGLGDTLSPRGGGVRLEAGCRPSSAVTDRQVAGKTEARDRWQDEVAGARLPGAPLPASGRGGAFVPSLSGWANSRELSEASTRGRERRSVMTLRARLLG